MSVVSRSVVLFFLFRFPEIGDRSIVICEISRTFAKILTFKIDMSFSSVEIRFHDAFVEF
jgi:hypothetical protein